MRKIAGVLCILMMLVIPAGCRSEDQSREADNTTAAVPQQQETQNGSTLIAYFSLAENRETPDGVDATTSASILEENGRQYGTTEYMAHMIQNEIGGDLYSIETTEEYPSDYDAVVDQNHEEAQEGTLPELKDKDLDLSDYETVLIGYPIWAASAPQAVFSFLDQYDLSDKTVIPFCTHDGYGAGTSYDEIADAVSGAEVLEGLAVEAEEVPDAEETAAQWIQDLGLETEHADHGDEQISIAVTAGEHVLSGVLYGTDLAAEIQEQFPLTVSMVNYGGREFYGGIDFTPENSGKGQLNFENGDITYCSQNNTMAVFYAQTENPDLTMEVQPIGKITSDLSVLEELPETAEMTFQIAK